jgi:ABC-type transport system substrate-binding protein
VRLTALRTGEVALIDQVPRASASTFASTSADRFQTWTMPTLGTSLIGFNVATGPFQDRRLRQAAAHAIDHEAMLQAVYAGQGEVATGYYGSASPWHVTGAAPWPEYDPDRARFLLRQARAVGAEVLLVTSNAPYTWQTTGELVQAMWTEVGFKVTYNVHDAAVWWHKLRAGDFHATTAGGSYRFDPDGWYSRMVLSTSPMTQMGGFRHARADRLITEARQTADKDKRLALYAEVDSIVNRELPYLYLVNVASLQAGARRLKGYQPAISGPFTTAGGGIRTAWLA